MRRAGALAGFVLALLALAEGRSATYDQRQSGDVNVQIDVKDLKIVALVDSDVLSDYANYDYAYDYADFTIKPRPTTGRPSSTASTPASPAESSTEAPSTTAANEQPTPPSTKAPASSVIAAGSSPMIIIPEGTNSTDAGKIIEGVSSANKVELEKQKEQQQQLEATTVSSTTASDAKPDENKRPAEPRKRCPVGFLLKSGRCFKRRLSLISPRLAIMKLAPRLLSKSKVLSAKLAAGNS